MPPPVFCKKDPEVLKTKDGSCEKSGKRDEECARDWRERR
jgi:hypothetical protein